MKKRLIRCITLAFYCNIFYAQIDAGFINHLTVAKLAKEHKTYLKSLPQFSDSTEYYKAKFNLKYFNDSLFLEDYFKSKPLCDVDSTLLAEASSAFLNNSNWQRTNKWFQSTQQSDFRNLTELQNIYKSCLNPNLFRSENFPDQLQPSFLKYKKAYNKKPFFAATLSTLIPGLGKLYVGKSRSLIATFILNGAYAAQTIESTRKLGPTHVLSIINIAGFTVFYLSNIYGSFKAVYQLRTEYKKQFIIDATRYYH